jgi:2-polyprenyl-6-methoxyphenol hydroxylase-like FAD-dependent oxidoreductase
VETYDVLIVGARCAGSPLATMLARRGLRVCVLDRSQFPSETISTHVIQPCGVAIMERLGVLDSVRAAGAAPITRISLLANDARIDADFDAQLEEYGAPSLCVRRVTLDQFLVNAAASAGAEVRTGTPVRSLVHVDGRVAGVETEGGPIRASLVVGADGRHSTVADLVGAAEYHVAPPGRLFAWAYFEGVEDREPRLRLARLGALAYLAGPTDADLYMAAVGPSIDERDGFLASRERNFDAGIQGWSELADLLAGGRRVGPIRVMADWHGYFREAAGPGWVLLGDAGHFKDPTPAQGISDAFRHAERLAEAIEAGLGGAVDLDKALRDWWRWRDEDGYEMHWFSTDLGVGCPARPIETQVIRDMADDQAAHEQLMHLLNHQVQPREVFTYGRVGRAAVRAIRRRPRDLPEAVREAATAIRNEVRRARKHPSRASAV